MLADRFLSDENPHFVSGLLASINNQRSLNVLIEKLSHSLNLYNGGTCDDKHLELINKLAKTLSDDKRIDVNEVMRFRKFNVMSVMRIKINGYVEKYQNLTRSNRRYMASVYSTYQQHKCFLSRFKAFFEFSCKPSAKFVQDVENYCKGVAPSYQAPIRGWIIKANPSIPKVVTHYKAQLFDNKITSSDLLQAVRDAEVKANESVNAHSALTGGAAAGSAMVDNFERRSDDSYEVSDFGMKVGDNKLQSSLKEAADDDSGFPKSDDLDDISEDDDFFDNLENPKKKPKLMLDAE